VIPLLVGAAAWAWAGTGWVGIPVGVLAYLVAVQLHPRTACWKCGGAPRVRDESGRNWRNCYACKGSGRRWRLLAVKRWME
jgi:hypothetical protein